MSRLAAQLPTPTEVTANRHRRGPQGACDIYGPGDLEDWAAVERLRLAHDWATAHREVDDLLGVTTPIDGDKFRYHWRRKCFHWTEDQRRIPLDQIQAHA